jgi:hypothetical protein
MAVTEADTASVALKNTKGWIPMLIRGMDGLTTSEMQEQYEVLGFSYGYCVVKRKSDGSEGTLSFERVGDTRYYYDFLGA